MSLPERIDHTFEPFSDREFYRDPDFIRFKAGLLLPHLFGNALQEIPRDETVLYLSTFARKQFEIRIPVRSQVSFRNDTGFAIRNVSIHSIRAQKEVFHLNTLPPQKNIQLEFIEAGRYSICYLIAGNRKIERKNLTLVPRPQDDGFTPHAFSSRFQRY